MSDDLVTDIWPHASALPVLRKRKGLSVEKAAALVGATQRS